MTTTNSSTSIVDTIFKHTGRTDGNSDGGTEGEKWAANYIDEHFGLADGEVNTQEEREAANKFAKKYDKDGDGALSDDETKIMMQDTNNDGKASKREQGDYAEYAADGNDVGNTPGPDIDKYDMYGYFGGKDKYENAGGTDSAFTSDGSGADSSSSKRDNSTGSGEGEGGGGYSYGNYSTGGGDMQGFITQMTALIKQFFGIGAA